MTGDAEEGMSYIGAVMARPSATHLYDMGDDGVS